MKAFREEISHLTAKHFTLERIKDKTAKLAIDLEKLMIDAPADMRRALRHIAEGNLGRLQAPAIEALGGRVTRYLARLPGAIISASLMVAGALLVIAPSDGGWHHNAGEIMVSAGIGTTIIMSIKSLRRDRGRGEGRR